PLGLAIRLVLARHSGGLQFDVSLFRQWSDRLVLRGPAHFYEPGYFADYPPGYLYVLLALGKASRVMSGEPPSLALLKLPAIIADLGVAALALLLAALLPPRAGATIVARVGLLVVFAVAVVVAMFQPFGVGPTAIPRFYHDAGSLYSLTSLWAFNAWGAAGFYRPDIGPGAVTVGGIAAFHL